MSDAHIHPQIIHNALQRLPAANFVLTCEHNGIRDGIVTKWVQQCSTDPPMLVVAIPKGQLIEPILRDARAFALCRVPANDRQASRLFGGTHERDEDPFLSIKTTKAKTGMPILPNALLWFDCKLEGHLSPDADCRLYLGQVIAAHIEIPNRNAKDELVTPPTHRQRKAKGTSAKTTSHNRLR